ncbi:hypothetical protein J1N35_025405 [Gossypium stocksii]|uniref:Uncharacterized protein n=1 Tax=Gossypium stocksii TaxID=47602 RepID=A0A9D3V6A0_9ROSI|nr:hypothetical protein J1N35_025405 [Gossypium stocksii]
MAVVLAMVVHGMGLLVKTLWGMQERRFSAAFETKPYAFGLKAIRQSLLLRVKRNYADFNGVFFRINRQVSPEMRK